MSELRSMKIDTFCERYGVSRPTVYREIAAGRLILRKRGASSLILADDAEAWAKALPEFKSGKATASGCTPLHPIKENAGRGVQPGRRKGS